MIRRPPRSTRTDTLFPYTTLFRSCFRSVCALRSDPRPSQIAISEKPSCSAGGFFLGYTIRSYATESYMIGTYIAVTSSCPGRVTGSAPAHRCADPRRAPFSVHAGSARYKILGVLVSPVIGVHRLAERFRGRLTVAVMVAIAMRSEAH